MNRPHRPLPRRDFLRLAGASSVAATAAAPLAAALARPLAAGALAAPDRERAAASASIADAIAAGRLPRLIPGCCGYSYNRYFRGGQLTYPEFMKRAVEMRLNAVDMTTYYLESREPAYLASLRHLGYRHGLAFSGAACGSSMVQADMARRAAVLNEIKGWVDVADQLGAPHLRVFGGKLPPGATVEQAIGWVVETMKPAADYAGAKGIMLGVEDHVGVTQDAGVCLEILRRVDNPMAGINLDITHFVPTPTMDAYAQIEACIPYATNTHIRAEFDDKTPIDMDRVWAMFAKAGFQGYMSVEYERELAGDEDEMTGVPKLVAKVRRLCARYSSVQ